MNLFITSVKFQRPITEVMWATIPFLITMIVALLTITYIPALTVVPDAERVGPAQTLVSIVRLGHEEAKVSIKDLALVDAAGTPLLDSGKSIDRHFKDCVPYQTKPELDACEKDRTDRKADPNAFKTKPRDPRCDMTETKQTTCEQIFLDVTDCIPDVKTKTPIQSDCANRAIALWTVNELNTEAAPDTSTAVIVANDVTFVDEDGKPLLDKEKKPVVGKDGKPITKKVASCDVEPDGKKRTGSRRDNCRYLFMRVSNCRISPDDLATCITNRTKDCNNDVACILDKTAACRKDKTQECERDKIAEWVVEFADMARE